jgi:hypothetical protein
LHYLSGLPLCVAATILVGNTFGDARRLNPIDAKIISSFLRHQTRSSVLPALGIQRSCDYCDTIKGRQMIHWKPVEEYVEPNWVKLETELPPILFWRPVKGAMLGFLRDGELFDAKWIYVCDANKVSHFSAVNTPADNVVQLEAHGEQS